MMSDRESMTIQTLINQFYDLLSRFGVDASNYMLDVVILKDVARRYWRDVERIHTFHNMQYIDNHKIGGYLSYWIVKLKPIQIANANVYFGCAKTPLYINELFALYVALGRTISHLKTYNLSSDLKLDNKFVDSFLYTLKYRITTGDNLAIMYYLIEKSCTRPAQTF